MDQQCSSSEKRPAQLEKHSMLRSSLNECGSEEQYALNSENGQQELQLLVLSRGWCNMRQCFKKQRKREIEIERGGEERRKGGEGKGREGRKKPVPRDHFRIRDISNSLLSTCQLLKGGSLPFAHNFLQQIRQEQNQKMNFPLK